jgi:hypothetical protein
MFWLDRHYSIPLSYGIILYRLSPIKKMICTKNLQIVLLTFSVWYFLCNYDLNLKCLQFRTLYSRRQRVGALFRNVFEGKINCHSIMDTVDIRVPPRQLRETPALGVSSALSHWLSARCFIAANYICSYVDIFSENISSESTFSVQESV